MSEFLDNVLITAHAGDGGNGCVSFRREKYVPHGGPDGGNGGRGGHVILRAKSRLTTLGHIRPNSTIRATRGKHGSGNNKTGAYGPDAILEVPLGTVVKENQTDKVLADLTDEDQTVIIAEGGKGGLGNAAFASSTNRTPRKAQPAAKGEKREIELELKILADVGIIGLPNAGKSTLTARISAARPKVASYPFTTLVPVLGIVDLDDSSFVIADIPGLIEGAHKGVGLGHKFLRHIERTRVMLHLVDLGSREMKEPVNDIQSINRELELYLPELAKKPQLIVGNKMDLNPPPERLDMLKRCAEELESSHAVISAATGQGIPEMLSKLVELLERVRKNDRVAMSHMIGNGGDS